MRYLATIGERIRRVVRGSLPMPLYKHCAAMLDAYYGVRQFGIKEYLNLLALSRSPEGKAPTEVHLRPLPHPLYVRSGTSDASVIIHAIAREAYSYKLPFGPVHLVIDAGANIGDTTVWYATRFPEALVVAIEPNSYNFDILQKNAAPYGDRIRCLNSALWPVPDRSLATTGATWTAQVRDSVDADSNICMSIDPLTILRDSGWEAIDIFKIDIEGAELALFLGDCDIWLRKTRSIAIEIHSREAREAVLSATRRNGFTYAVYRDLHVFWK